VRKLASVAVSLVALAGTAHAAGFIEPGFFETGFIEEGFFEEDGAPPMDVAVPDVVGQADFAAADTIFEGDGLDGNELAARCSTAPLNEIISQNPIAGALVPLGTIIDVTPSSGMECPPGGGSRLDLQLRLTL
jgi:hypothetical protein